MTLVAREICKAYGPLQVLNQVSLSCPKGQVSGLIGPNGAGKSTLFRILLGLVRKDAGTVAWDADSPKPLGGIIEKPALYGYLSARDNLRVFSRIQGLSLDKGRYEELMGQVGLSPDRQDPVRHYSMGMKQRLGLAIALLNRPRYLILDEPFSGLDPIGIRALQRQIRSLAEGQGIGVLISSHNLVELGDLCDTLYVINRGEIVRTGPALEILGKSASRYVLYGSGLEGSGVLKALGAEVGRGKALVSPDSRGITGVLRDLMGEEGVALSACIPQTNLEALFEKEAP